MAARLRLRHQEDVKQKIRASQLVNRLQDHAFGEIEMSTTQVDSAKFLLNKLISNAPIQNEVTGADGGPLEQSLTVTFVGAGTPGEA